MQYIVTGANRGIGLEFVKQLAGRGDDVIATARDPQLATDLHDVAEASDGKVRVAQLDIIDEESVRSFIDKIDGTTVDVLINNAGRLSHGSGPGDFDFEAMRNDFETNVIGTLRVTQAVLPLLGGAKKIVNLSSKMGSISDNGSGGSYPYRMSKAALNMATKSLANDLKSREIVVITMHPGWVQTRMGGSNALIETETSVEGLLDVIDDADLEDSGKFWEWKGVEIPW